MGIEISAIEMQMEKLEEMQKKWDKMLEPMEKFRKMIEKLEEMQKKWDKMLEPMRALEETERVMKTVLQLNKQQAEISQLTKLMLQDYEQHRARVDKLKQEMAKHGL